VIEPNLGSVDNMLILHGLHQWLLLFIQSSFILLINRNLLRVT